MYTHTQCLKKKLLKIQFFLIKEKTLGWFHPYCLLRAASPPRTHFQLSRCVQAGVYWNTEEQGGQCVLGSESAEALGACERVEIAGREGTVCPESSWEPLMQLACWAVLGRRDTAHIWKVLERRVCD